MVSDLHQGTGASDLLFCVRWKRKSANPSTKTPSPGATATNLFGGSGVNNGDFWENQTMETSKTKELTPNLMRTFSVLLDQNVDVTCSCTRADTLDAAPAANALDSAPSGRERLESRQSITSVSVEHFVCPTTAL